MTALLPLVDLLDHPNEGCLESIRDLCILQTTKKGGKMNHDML